MAKDRTPRATPCRCGRPVYRARTRYGAEVALEPTDAALFLVQRIVDQPGLSASLYPTGPLTTERQGVFMVAHRCAL